MNEKRKKRRSDVEKIVCKVIAAFVSCCRIFLVAKLVLEQEKEDKDKKGERKECNLLAAKKLVFSDEM